MNYLTEAEKQNLADRRIESFCASFYPNFLGTDIKGDNVTVRFTDGATRYMTKHAALMARDIWFNPHNFS